MKLRALGIIKKSLLRTPTKWLVVTMLSFFPFSLRLIFSHLQFQLCHFYHAMPLLLNIHCRSESWNGLMRLCVFEGEKTNFTVFFFYQSFTPQRIQLNRRRFEAICAFAANYCKHFKRKHWMWFKVNLQFHIFATLWVSWRWHIVIGIRVRSHLFVQLSLFWCVCRQ